MTIERQRKLQILKSSVLWAVIFGVVMGIYFSIKFQLASGIVYGVMCASLGFVLMAGSLLVLMRSVDLPDSLKGNKVIYSGVANRLDNGVSNGGLLFLTTNELVFVAHAMNTDSSSYRIPISAIQSVKPVATIGVIPNGLKVIQCDGTTHRFVVYGRGLWIRLVLQQINTNHQATSRNPQQETLTSLK